VAFIQSVVLAGRKVGTVGCWCAFGGEQFTTAPCCRHLPYTALPRTFRTAGCHTTLTMQHHPTYPAVVHSSRVYHLRLCPTHLILLPSYLRPSAHTPVRAPLPAKLPTTPFHGGTRRLPAIPTLLLHTPTPERRIGLLRAAASPKRTAFRSACAVLVAYIVDAYMLPPARNIRSSYSRTFVRDAAYNTSCRAGRRAVEFRLPDAAPRLSVACYDLLVRILHHITVAT